MKMKNVLKIIIGVFIIIVSLWGYVSLNMSNHSIFYEYNRSGENKYLSIQALGNKYYKETKPKSFDDYNISCNGKNKCQFKSELTNEVARPIELEVSKEKGAFLGSAQNRVMFGTINQDNSEIYYNMEQDGSYTLLYDDNNIRYVDQNSNKTFNDFEILYNIIIKDQLNQERVSGINNLQWLYNKLN